MRVEFGPPGGPNTTTNEPRGTLAITAPDGEPGERARKPLATRAFRVGPSGKLRLKLRLNRRGRTLLRHRRVVRTTAIVVFRDPDGTNATVRWPLTLRR